MPESLNVRQPVRDFLRYFEVPAAAPAAAEELIQVSQATKRIAFAYERFRNTLEPDEQEILRRRAIMRILERRLFEDRPPAVIATTLLQELIRGNYVRPMPRSMADVIAKDLQKGRRLYSVLDVPHQLWLLNLVAVAIDHRLFPSRRQEALVHLMYHDTYHRVVWADTFFAVADRLTQ